MKHILVEENPTDKDFLCVISNKENIFIKGRGDSYKFIDLGLPSGTKWADRNVGAADEYSTGLYFQWGDTQGYTADQVGTDKQFSWDEYKFGSSSPFSKYDADGKKVLDLEDDAARVHMGDEWIMPTIEQFQELVDNTTQEYSSENGGYIKFISKKDSSKFIVLSASGGAGNGGLYDVGQSGSCWSSSLYSDDVDSACYCYFYVEYENVSAVGYLSRYYGLPVRGVLAQ